MSSGFLDSAWTASRFAFIRTWLYRSPPIAGVPPLAHDAKSRLGPRAERQVGRASRPHAETWKNTIDPVVISTQRSDDESIPAHIVMIGDRSVHFVYLSFVCSFMRSARRLPTAHHSPSRRQCRTHASSRIAARDSPRAASISAHGVTPALPLHLDLPHAACIASLIVRYPIVRS